ncbi:protein FAM161B isoform 2-T4 [Anomaloglossus baeobatrachus]|uniref:protein FAM161B n=1 Tax=Anomaloglossus baeobatrachus TaxID=238106 RepID=UPI003F4F8088
MEDIGTWRIMEEEDSAHPACKPKAKVSSKVPEFTVPHPFQMMLRESEKSKMLQSQAWADVPDGQSAEDAECMKQFRAQPAPAHIFLPMYKEIMEQNEKRRKTGIQKRNQYLLSMQKPFHFLVQDKRRQVTNVLPVKVPSRKRSIPKSVLDPTVSDGLREAEILQKINSQIRAKKVLDSSSSPVPLTRDTREPQSRASFRTKQQQLGFLQQNLTFKPQINPCAPDFQMLHRNLRKSSLKNQRVQGPTKTKPFTLHTTSISSKRCSSSQDTQGTSMETHPHRLAASLSSLSVNTLTVYITDCTKRREAAIRFSVQDKDNRDIQREKWLGDQRQKSLAMQKSVARRAKALDPHKPLAVCNEEKLKQNRNSDHRRTQEYKKELEEMKTRVSMRAYLFEQVTKGHAIKDVEGRFTQTSIKS